MERVQTTTWTRPRALLVAATLWACLYLPGLGQLEFRGEEGRRVLPAMAMLRGPAALSNWLVPQIAGERYFNKPPGINWIVAASFAITGRQDEFTARLPSALAVLLFVGLLIGLDSLFLDVPARLIGAAAFMASPILIIKGRMIEIDAIYTCLTGLAILCWLNAFARGDRPWRQWLIPAALLAAGALVKGPFLGVPFYAVVICTLAYTHKLRQLIRPPHLVGVALILVVGLGWLILVRYLAGAELVNRTIEGQFAARALEISPKHWLKEVGQALLYWLPWTAMLPILWMRSFVDRVPPAYRPLFRGCRLGMVLGFAGLCLVPGLLSRYTIPALPMAAILLGWLLAPRRGLLASDRLWRGILLLLPALLILLAVAASVAMKFGRTSNWLSRLAGEGVVLNLHWTAELVAAMAALAIIGGMLWLIRTRLSSGVDLALVTAVMAAVFVLLSVQVYSSLWPHGEKRRAEAMQINEAVPAGQTLYVFRPSYQRFLIFLRQPVQYLLEPRQMSPQVRYLLLASEPRDEAYLPRVQALQKKLDREYRTTLLCELIQPASKTEKKQVFQLLECQPRSMDIPPATAASQAAEP